LKPVLTYITLLLLACTLALPAQSNRKLIAWTGISAEKTYKKYSAFFELENSRVLIPARKDYFTAISNLEYSASRIRPAAGFSYWQLFDEREKKVPELRPHLQLSWLYNSRKHAFTHRTRLEHRFIGDTLNKKNQRRHRYVLRPRFIFQYAYYIRGGQDKNSLQAVVSEEILLNFINGITFFSENRMYAGLWYTVFKTSQLRLGYVWVYSKDRNINNSDIIYLTLKKDF